MFSELVQLSKPDTEPSRLKPVNTDLALCVSDWIKTYDGALVGDKTVYEAFKESSDKAGFIQSCLDNVDFISALLEDMPAIISGSKTPLRIGNCIICNGRHDPVKVVRLALLSWIGVTRDCSELNLSLKLTSCRHADDCVRILRLKNKMHLTFDDLDEYGLDFGNPQEFLEDEGYIVFPEGSYSLKIFDKDCKKLKDGRVVTIPQFISEYNSKDIEG